MQDKNDDCLTIECLISNYGGMVASICKRMIQNKDTADDAAQDVWLEVAKSLGSFRNESKISTWLYSIATRVVMKAAKEERLYSIRFLCNYFHGDDIEVPDYIDLDKKLWVREMCDKCLTGTLHCLNNESRLAYILRDIGLVPYSEIAEILELDEASVRKMVSRSRKKLRSFLNDECILKNADSRCKCRMSNRVKEVDLQEEYTKLYKAATKISFYRASEMILPQKNYWLKHI